MHVENRIADGREMKIIGGVDGLGLANHLGGYIDAVDLGHPHGHVAHQATRTASDLQSSRGLLFGVGRVPCVKAIGYVRRDAATTVPERIALIPLLIGDVVVAVFLGASVPMLRHELDVRFRQDGCLG